MREDGRTNPLGVWLRHTASYPATSAAAIPGTRYLPRVRHGVRLGEAGDRAARAIGREGDLGSLERGKLADVALVDLAQPHAAPAGDPVGNLVYSAHGGDVDTVLVGGRVLLRSRRVLHVDEEAVLAQARDAAERVVALLGHARPPRWPRA